MRRGIYGRRKCATAVSHSLQKTNIDLAGKNSQTLTNLSSLKQTYEFAMMCTPWCGLIRTRSFIFGPVWSAPTAYCSTPLILLSRHDSKMGRMFHNTPCRAQLRQTLRLHFNNCRTVGHDFCEVRTPIFFLTLAINTSGLQFFLENYLHPWKIYPQVGIRTTTERDDYDSNNRKHRLQDTHLLHHRGRMYLSRA